MAESLDISHHAYVLENGSVVLSGARDRNILYGERVGQAYLGERAEASFLKEAK